MDLSLPFANGFYSLTQKLLSSQQCVNLYPNIVEVESRTKVQLLRTAGITQVATTGTVSQQNRGAIEMNDSMFFVNGSSLYRLNVTIVDGVETFSYDDLGTISGTGPVSMSQNGTQVIIVVPESTGYIFTEDPDTLTEISDVNYTANGNPQGVIFVDGYFFFTTSTQKVIVSDLRDGSTYTALDRGSAEADPDALVYPTVIDGDPYAIGTETSQGYTNIGGSGFPFTPNNVVVRVGCASRFTVQSVPSYGAVFVGSGQEEALGVHLISGSSRPTRISNRAVEELLGNLNSNQVGSLRSWYYGEAGHLFYGIVSDDWCMVYDFTTNRWHERKSRINDQQRRWRVAGFVNAAKRTYALDVVDGRVGRLSQSVVTEYGVAVTREFSGAPFQNDGAPLRIENIELVCEPGVGNDASTDPQVELSISTNEGFSYDYSMSRSLGAQGNYRARTIFNRLGMFPRAVVFKVSCSAPVEFSVLQITAKVT